MSTFAERKGAAIERARLIESAVQQFQDAALAIPGVASIDDVDPDSCLTGAVRALAAMAARIPTFDMVIAIATNGGWRVRITHDDGAVHVQVAPGLESASVNPAGDPAAAGSSERIADRPRTDFPVAMQLAQLLRGMGGPPSGAQHA